MDWRGQSGSERYLDNPQKGHSVGFEHDVADLNQFLTTVINQRGKPIFAVAGSMGAHIMLRYMHDYPDFFDSAVLVSPAFDIDTGNWPHSIARLISKLGTSLGFSEHYIRGGDWKLDAKRLRGLGLVPLIRTDTALPIHTYANGRNCVWAILRTGG